MRLSDRRTILEQAWFKTNADLAVGSLYSGVDGESSAGETHQPLGAASVVSLLPRSDQDVDPAR